MGKIKIGTIVNAVGLKGEIKMYNFSENPDRYEKLEEIYLLIDGDHKPYRIEKVRYKGSTVILKLVGIDDRNESETMKNIDIYMDEDDLEELPEGVYYVKDMIGMDVVSEGGQHLGRLKDVLTDTPQKVYVVERRELLKQRQKRINGKSNGENKNRMKRKPDILIPGVDEFILNIDMENNTITVRVIEGLYED